MNDSLSVYLNLDMENRSRNEEVIRKIDKLLLTVGMKYSGITVSYTHLRISFSGLRLCACGREAASEEGALPGAAHLAASGKSGESQASAGKDAGGRCV